MKIVLISTLKEPTNQGLRILSSILKNANYNVTMVFMTSNKSYNKGELEQLGLICKNCDLVGLSSFSEDTIKTIQIIDFLKKKVKNIVWGGVHATLYPEDCIKHCDIVCVGEGEDVILDLVKTIEKNKSIDNIKNLWIKKEGTIIKNPIRNMIDKLDNIPFPDFKIETHFILKKEKIQKFKEEDLNGQIRFMTGRGCPYGCGYCSNNVFNKLYRGKRRCVLRYHSINYIINFLSYLKNKFSSVECLEISDDSFSFRPLPEIKEFSERYKKEVGIKFYCSVDAITLVEEKVKLLSDAGCHMITSGIQSSEKINREIYNRNITDKQVLNCAKILNKFKENLSANYDVITCNPYEKPEDIINLINLLRKLPKPYRLAVSGLIFFPGTDITNMALRDNLIKKEDLFLDFDYSSDNGKYLLMRKKNLYLNLIVTLMRGISVGNKIGSIHDSWFDYLLDERRVKKNLRNPSSVILFIRFWMIYNFIKYKIIKKIYENLPKSFKEGYMKVRLKDKIVYNSKQN